MAVDRVREGEEVVGFIDLASQTRDPAAFSTWLSARLEVGELQRLLLPPCDGRCRSQTHDRARFFVLADIALVRTRRRPSAWRERSFEAGDERTKSIWYAAAPAPPTTDTRHRLAAGARLRRLAVSDPIWVHDPDRIRYDAVGQETLFKVTRGSHKGELVIAATFGPSPLLPGLAGALIAPDHPPVRDPAIAIRLLAAGWAAVGRGMPYEE
jgi:hypothetical protein